MLKGIQKQMIMVKTEKSSLFETAYFVLRDDAAERDRADIVAEANKLVSGVVRDASPKRFERKKPAKKRLVFFALGALFGGALSFLAVWFISLF